MEKSRFDIINDLFKLSHMVSDSLKLMESLADKDSGNQMEICRNIKYSLKTMPFLLDGIREYIAEHEDKELARKFVGLYSDTKRLHNLCSKHADLNKAAFRTGMAYMSMEVIGQYFFPETETQKVAAGGLHEARRRQGGGQKNRRQRFFCWICPIPTTRKIISMRCF